MDDERDRRYSRAPELEDLVRLCAALNDAGARYLLIGGFAVILHGLVRTTKDVDLLVDPSVDNVRALKRALATLPDNAASLMEDHEVAKYGLVRVADEIVVDLMAKACNITYDEAIAAGVETCDLEGVLVPVAGPELLFRMKDTARESDRSDRRFLALLIEQRRREGGR